MDDSQTPTPNTPRFKKLIMAISYASRAGRYPDWNVNLLYALLFVVIPFVPAARRLMRIEHEQADTLLFATLFFYLSLRVLIGWWGRHQGRAWSDEEYEALKMDQVFFPYAGMSLALGAIAYLIAVGLEWWLIG